MENVDLRMGCVYVFSTGIPAIHWRITMGRRRKSSMPATVKPETVVLPLFSVLDIKTSV